VRAAHAELRLKVHDDFRVFQALFPGRCVSATRGVTGVSTRPVMTRASDRPAMLRIFAQSLSLLVAALGASVLGGWALDIGVLQNLLSGRVSMKPDTAAGLLLSGSALALLSRATVGTAARLLAGVAAAAVFVLGALNLADAIFGWNLEVDQWLFRELAGSHGRAAPGPMTPSSAFCLVLTGTAIALASQVQGLFRDYRGTPVLSALGGMLVIVGGLALLGHLLLEWFDIRIWNYAGMAASTGAGFALLGCALLLGLRSEGGLVWSLDAPTAAGFAIGVIGVLAANGISYTYTDQLRQDAQWVSLSQEVLKEIQELKASERDLTLSLGRYLITHDESSVADRARIEAAIDGGISHIRKLTAGDSAAQNRIDDIERLTARRIAMSDEIIAKVRRQAASTGEPPAARRNESALGDEYPKLGQDIDRALDAMESEFSALLRQRQMQSDSSTSKTFLLMPVAEYVCLTMMLVGLFWLNRGTAERRRAEGERAESETYFHTVFEATPDGMIIADRQRNVIIANPAAERMFGYATGQIRGIVMEQLVPEANRPALLRDWGELTQRPATGAAAGPREIEGARKDGSVFPVELTRNIFETPGGGYVLGVVRDISDRRQIEITRARLAAIVEASDDAIIGKTLDGIIASWNAGAERLFGYSAREAVGRPIAMIIPQDRLNEENLIIGQIAKGETVRHYETVRLRKDGSAIDISVTVSPMRDAAGNVIGASKIARDIGERKRAEEKLRESEQHNRTLMESLADGVFVAQDFRFVFANPALVAMLGYSPEVFSGLSFGDVVAPEFLELWNERFLARVGTGPEPPAEYEVRLLRKDGGSIIAELRASRVRFKGRTAALGVIRDTTERRRAEQKLRDSEQELRTVTDAIPSLIAYVDRDRRYRFANLAYQQWFSLARDGIVGRRMEEVLGADAYREIAGYLEQAYAGRRQNFERKQLRRDAGADDRTSTMHVNYVPNRGEYGAVNGVFIVAHDISDVKRAEERALRTQKMEALGTLAGGIAHDFNNILPAILGYANLAEGDLSEEHPARPSIAEIKKASNRAADLVRRILNFSRPQEHATEAIELESVVSEALKLVRSTLPTAIELRVDLAAGVPPVVADPTHIYQIVVNLLTNANDAIGARAGIIELQLDTVEPNSEISGLAAGRYARLTVSDDGSGMDRETQRRIFDPFFTTKSPGKGTGLGLSIVNSIMKGLGGAVNVYSEPGKGTRFLLYFPVAEDSGEYRALPGAKVREREREHGRGEHIMYIDDEEALVFLVGYVLKQLGYEVSGYTEADAALDEFRLRPHYYHAVITDASMPGASGYDVTRKLCAIRPGVPIIMVSGYVRSEDEEHALSAGARRLIPKPNNVEELGAAIASLLRDEAARQDLRRTAKPPNKS
jgi:PAS domain S-box-containing protein